MATVVMAPGWEAKVNQAANRRVVPDAAKDIALRTRHNIIGNWNIDTWAMFNSVRVRRQGRGWQMVIGGSGIEYWFWIEYGRGPGVYKFRRNGRTYTRWHPGHRAFRNVRDAVEAAG